MNASPKCLTSSLLPSPMGFVRNEKGCLWWLTLWLKGDWRWWWLGNLFYNRFCLGVFVIHSMPSCQPTVPSCETCNACMGVGWYPGLTSTRQGWHDACKGTPTVGRWVRTGGSAPMHVSRPMRSDQTPVNLPTIPKSHWITHLRYTVLICALT